MDLEPISTDGVTDVFSIYEISLPFSRTLISRYWQKVKDAEKECGFKGYVTIDALKKGLATPAWADLKDSKSMTYKLFVSDLFKDVK